MFFSRLVTVLLAGVTVLLCFGCAGTPSGTTSGRYIFYPPPPVEPRIQFLASYQDSDDVEGKKSSALSKFVLGEEEKVNVRPIIKPYGVVAANGNIYIADTMRGRVLVLNLPKKSFRFLGQAEGLPAPGGTKKPINLTVDGQGNLYVVDVKLRQVLIYDRNENPVGTVGAGYLERPTCVAVWKDRIFVGDRAKSQIMIFSLEDGELVDTFGPKLSEEIRIKLPLNMAMGPDGVLHVVDAGLFKVLRMDVDGHLLSTVGKLGDVPGTFSRPKGIGVGPDKIFYVADSAFDNVQVFREDGRILTFFGGPGLEEGQMYLPAGVNVSMDNLDFFQKMAAPGFKLQYIIYVTNQYGPNKLSVYGFGQKEK